MGKILIVDDTSFIRKIIKNILIKNNYNNIEEAYDGKMAIDKYFSFRPDLIIMDIIMPELNGIQALKKIREIDENCKIIICSSINQENLIKEAIYYGAGDFIVKPFTEKKIVNIVGQYFKNKNI